MAVLLLVALLACRGAEREEEKEQQQETKKEPIGIVTAELRAATDAQSRLIGYATVLDLTELFAAASQYAGAEAQRQQAAAQLRSTNAELQRQRVLNADDHNISDRAVQQTAAAAASDAAAVRAAEVSLRATQNAARQRWGAVLANGVIANTAWARQLASGDAALLEVAFDTDEPAPATVHVQARTARYLARAPRVNTRLLRASHYYIVAPGSEFPVGLTLELRANGGGGSGVLVPEAAVVWINGAATVFVEDRPSHYQPHAISAASHVAGGYIETALAPGTKVVVQGAQQLAAE